LLALDIFEKALDNQLIDRLIIIRHNIALFIILRLAIIDWTDIAQIALTNQK